MCDSNYSDLLDDSELNEASILKNLPSFQKKIYESTAPIENYLNNSTNKQKSSESYRFLESLFALFKSELKINLVLRNSLVNERNLRRESELEVTNMYQYFKEMGKLTNTNIGNYKDALETVCNIKKNYGKFRSEKEIEIAQKDEEIRAIKASLQSSENSNSNNQESLKKLNESVQLLQERVASVELEKKSLSEENSDIKALLIKKSEQLKYTKAQLSKIPSLESELSIQQRELKDKCTSFEEMKSDLTIKLNKSDEDCKQLKLKIAQLEQDVSKEQDTISHMERTNKDLRIENENHKRLNTELNSSVTALQKKILLMKKKQKRLIDESQKLLENNSELEGINNEQSSAIKELRNVNKNLGSDQESIQSNVEILTQKCEDLAKVIEQTESRAQKRLHSIERLKAENERLRNKMRGYTPIIDDHSLYTDTFIKLRSYLGLSDNAGPKRILNAVYRIVHRQ